MHRFKQAKEAYKRSMHVTLTKQTGGWFQFNEPLMALFCGLNHKVVKVMVGWLGGDAQRKKQKAKKKIKK